MIDITKRIFITWGTWFVGASILHRLVSLWAEDIHVLIREDSNTSRIDSIRDRINFHTFALEDKEQTQKKIGEIQPKIIFHLAALGAAVGRVPFTLDEYIISNTLGTAHLIDAAVVVWCECFINTGSSSEYGQKDTPMSEDNVLEPNNFYALSKATATQYASYVGKTRNFPIVTYRLFSVYWPLEDQKRLIPTLVKNYREGTPPMLSSPHSVRDFIYIDDVTQCFLEANKAMNTPGDIINIGTGIQSSISDVVRTLQQITWSTIEPEYGQQKMNQLEPKSWLADSSKMRKILEVMPKNLHEGLRQMLERTT